MEIMMSVIEASSVYVFALSVTAAATLFVIDKIDRKQGGMKNVAAA